LPVSSLIKMDPWGIWSTSTGRPRAAAAAPHQLMERRDVKSRRFALESLSTHARGWRQRWNRWAIRFDLFNVQSPLRMRFSNQLR